MVSTAAACQVRKGTKEGVQPVPGLEATPKSCVDSAAVRHLKPLLSFDALNRIWPGDQLTRRGDRQLSRGEDDETLFNTARIPYATRRL